MVVVKWTHDKRKKKDRIKKGQISLCLRKYMPFCHLLWRLLKITSEGEEIVRMRARDEANYY